MEDESQKIAGEQPNNLKVIVAAKDKMEQAIAVLSAENNSPAMAHIIAQAQRSIDLLRIEIYVQLLSPTSEDMKQGKAAASERQNEALAEADGRPYMPPLNSNVRIKVTDSPALRLQKKGRIKRQVE